MEVRDVKLGALTNGGVIRLDVRLQEFSGKFETIDHQWVDNYVRFSISARVYHGYGCAYCGQIQDYLRNLRTAEWSRKTDRARVKTVLNVWDRWHLNDLHANCVHQAEIGTSGADWKARQADETRKCPEGYVYGSKWLVEPLPDDVIARIKALFF
jgi:hypothetical protein